MGGQSALAHVFQCIEEGEDIIPESISLDELREALSSESYLQYFEQHGSLLHQAILARRPDLVAYLLLAGHPADRPLDYNGMTPLQCAVVVDSLPSVLLLLDKQANVTDNGTYGDSVVQIAAEMASGVVLGALLYAARETGCLHQLLCTKNSRGITPMMAVMHRKKDRRQLIRIISSYGGHCDVPGPDGLSLIDDFREKGANSAQIKNLQSYFRKTSRLWKPMFVVTAFAITFLLVRSVSSLSKLSFVPLVEWALYASVVAYCSLYKLRSQSPHQISAKLLTARTSSQYYDITEGLCPTCFVKGEHCRLCGRCYRQRHHHCYWMGFCVTQQSHFGFATVCFCWCILALYFAICVFASPIYPEMRHLYRNNDFIQLAKFLGVLIVTLAGQGLLLYVSFFGMIRKPVNRK